MRVLIFIAAVAIATQATAQSTADSASLSDSYSASGVYIEGSNIPDNTPGLGGLVGSSGNCYPGAGINVATPGLGFNVGGGVVDMECNVRMEMAALAAVAGNRVAVAHACKHDTSMRQTLVEMGLCKVVRSSAATAPQADEPRRRPDVTPVPERVSYRNCEYDRSANQIRVSPARGYTSATAVRDCREKLGF